MSGKHWPQVEISPYSAFHFSYVAREASGTDLRIFFRDSRKSASVRPRTSSRLQDTTCSGFNSGKTQKNADNHLRENVASYLIQSPSLSHTLWFQPTKVGTENNFVVKNF